LIEYELIRSQKRKSIGLQVKQGKIIIRAPYFANVTYIDQVVQSKKVWLKEKVQQQLHSTSNQMCFKNGGIIWLLGEQKRLIVAFGDSNEIKECSGSVEVIVKTRVKTEKKQTETNIVSLAVSPSAEQVKKRLELWLKAKASDYILDKVIKYSEQLALHPKSVNIRQYKARWGSCNNRGELSFNYLLMMAPKWVIDYVIIHELCHLKHLNHRPAFWLLVQKHCRYYQDAKLWLKTNQTNLYWSL